MDEESDPSQPSRLISEALRVASSIEQQRNGSKVAMPYGAVHQVNLVKMRKRKEFALNIAKVPFLYAGEMKSQQIYAGAKTYSRHGSSKD